MLQPDNRFTFFDSMRPPEGFVFESCIVSTFTLDLKALLALPGMFAMHRDADAANDLPPVEILHAIRKHASQISVFSQAGEIAVPPSVKVFGFLEGSVIPVNAPNKGVVHPKVWVLRFTKIDNPGETVLRVIIASRNLTFDSSWDTIARLDENENGSSLEPLVELFKDLSRQTIGNIEKSHIERVDSICRDLKRATFQIPSPFDAMRCHVFGLAKNKSPFPSDFDRSIVISPFISREFFERVVPQRIDTLVSREEELMKLGDLPSIDQKFWFDDGSAVDENDGPRGPAEPIRGLHAKVFGFESKNETTWFVGSANATGAAFRSNIEVLLELSGPTKQVGINQVIGTSEDNDGLQKLFRAFSDQPNSEFDVEETSGLESLRRAIASNVFYGHVSQAGDDWNVTYETKEAINSIDEIEIYCWPTNDPQSKRALPLSNALNQTFKTSLTGISGFLGFELVSGTLTSTFCVPVQLLGLPHERDAELMRTLIGSSERFFGYLVALLDDSSQLSLTDDLAYNDGDGTRTTGRSTDMPPVLEKLLKAMRTDRTKLLGLEAIVHDLNRDQILPDGFMDIWNAIVEVAGLPQ